MKERLRFKKLDLHFFFFIFFLFSIFPKVLKAQEAGKNDFLVISPVIAYSSSLVHRGALIWPAPRLFAGAGLSIGNTLSLGGEGLALTFRFAETHIIGAGLTFFDDNGPSSYSYQFKKRNKDFRNLRKSSLEVYARYEYALKGIFSMGINIHKDLKIHYGEFIYAKLGLPFYFFPLLSFQAGLGFGTRAHNHYVFGDGAKAGFTHYDYGTGLMLPFLPWRGSLRISYMNSKVIHVENKYASYVLPHDNLERTSIMAMWQI